MAVLEPVVATLIANTTEFQASMTAAKASMAEMGASGDLSKLEGGLGGIGVAGRSAETGLKDAETATKDAGIAAAESGGKFGFLSNIIGGLPGPLGEAHAKTEEFRGSLDNAGKSGGGFMSSLQSIPTPVLAVGAAIAGVAAVSVDLASKYQTATNQIAASEGISTSAAAAVGQAFLTTAGTVTFSGQQIATAFAQVAGQAKEVNNGALSAAQSLMLMKAAMDLAEASGTSLNSATSDITKTLQLFGLGISQSPLVSDVLFNAAKKSGTSVDALSAAIQRGRATMGVMAPSIQQFGGLMLDMAEHGETGRKAISALNTVTTGIITPAENAATAQKNLSDAFAALPPTLQKLATEYQSGNVTAAQVTSATKGLTTAQSDLWKAFVSTNTKSQTTQDAIKNLGFSAFNSQGQFIGMGAVIDKLHAQIAGMNPEMALAQLKTDGLGSSAKTLLPIIQAGSEAFNKDTAAVSAHGSAADAAAKATSGMSASFEKAKVAIEDAAIMIGQKLMPVVTAIAQAIASATAFIVQHKEVLYGLGILIGGALTAIITAFAINTIGSMISSIERAGSSVVGLVSKLFGLDAGLTAEAGAATEAAAANERLAVTGTEAGSAMGAEGMAGGMAAGGEAAGGLTGVLGPLGLAVGGITLGAVLLGNAISGHTVPALSNAIVAANNMSATALPQMTLKMQALTEAQNIAARAMNDGGIAGQVARESYNGLGRQIDQLKAQQTEYTANVNTLSQQFGVSTNMAQSMAQAIGVNLGGALTKADVTAFAQQLQQAGINADTSTAQINGVAAALVAADATAAIAAGTWSNLGGAIGAAASAAVRAAQNIGQAAAAAVSTAFGGGGGVPHRAGGGPIVAGQTYLVGENGPELFAAGYSGAIVPISMNTGGSGVSPIQSSGGGGGTTVLNVTTPIQINGQTLAQIVTQYQLRGARATGSALGQYAGGTQSQTATGINTNAVAR